MGASGPPTHVPHEGESGRVGGGDGAGAMLLPQWVSSLLPWNQAEKRRIPSDLIKQLSIAIGLGKQAMQPACQMH